MMILDVYNSTQDTFIQCLIVLQDIEVIAVSCNISNSELHVDSVKVTFTYCYKSWLHLEPHQHPTFYQDRVACHETRWNGYNDFYHFVLLSYMDLHNFYTAKDSPCPSPAKNFLLSAHFAFVHPGHLNPICLLHGCPLSR